MSRAVLPHSPARGDAAAELPFDVVVSKLAVPRVREGTVRRKAVVNRLRTAAAFATVVAPAGYGKTTILAEWAERDSRPFAWVSIDHRDDDVVTFLRHVAAAVDTVVPLGDRALAALGSRARSVWESAVPRLASALASAGRPFVLVLDDADLLRGQESLEVLKTVVAHIPDGSMLALSGRKQPQLPLTGLRLAGRLLELGPEHLALSRREGRLLVQATGASVDDAEVDSLVERCEGWPAALFLAGMSLAERSATGGERLPFTGADRLFADYVGSEYLSHLRPGIRRFLRRTAVLDRMSGELCDAVLDDVGSGAELERLQRAGVFVVPLDERGEWYRYHTLVRDLLRRELAHHEPHLVKPLHDRAADWFAAQGEPESALEHGARAGDDARVATILAAITPAAYRDGRALEVDCWLDRFDRPGLLERFPRVALHGSRVHAFRGRTSNAERWLAAAERGTFSGRLPDGSGSLSSWIAVVRATLCRDGPSQMLADAEQATHELPSDSDWSPLAHVLVGVAHLLLGDDQRADDALVTAIRHAEHAGCRVTRTLALGERAILAATRDDHELAETLATEARNGSARLAGYSETAPALAAGARVLLRRGRWDEARSRLETARSLTGLLTAAVPWLAVQARLELARAALTFRDAEAAGLRLTEAEQVLRLRPELGRLRDQVHELRRELDEAPEPRSATANGLTAAELRLLPLLATHLSFREIGERLFVSRNTIKTQSISVYRKLGVSSRSEAIAEAERLGLGGGSLTHGR